MLSVYFSNNKCLQSIHEWMFNFDYEILFANFEKKLIYFSPYQFLLLFFKFWNVFNSVNEFELFNPNFSFGCFNIDVDRDFSILEREWLDAVFVDLRSSLVDSSCSLWLPIGSRSIHLFKLIGLDMIFNSLFDLDFVSLVDENCL